MSSPKLVRSIGMDQEELFDRALSLLSFMDVQDAATHLVDAGVGGEDAFLAVKAAEILMDDGQVEG